MNTMKRAAAGFSLVELMIAMVLGLIISGAVIGSFIAASRSYQQDERLSGVQDELRFGVTTMTHDFEMAGFWGDLLNPNWITRDTNLAGTGNCGPTANWSVANLIALAGVDNITGNPSTFPCITDAQAGTDVVSIKRTLGLAATPAAGGIYLRSNGTSGLLFRNAAPTVATTIPAPFTEWQFRSAIYYVRNHSVTAGDGIPTLCRKILDSSFAYVTECLAEGVQNLQVEYGIDNNVDGTPDRYVNATTATSNGDFNVNRVASVRFWLLVRSAAADPNYRNAKTYTIGNSPAFSANNDRFYRKTISQTVVIRNPNALRRMLGTN